MILVVAGADDDHADAVLARLARRGERAERLDLSTFPRDRHLSLAYDADRDGDDVPTAEFGDLDLDDCGVVWWRRPQPFDVPEAVGDHTDRSFAYAECQSAVDGLWLTLDADWVNHPTSDDEAERKPYQLQVADEVGFTIPETLVTSDPERAAAFVDDHGPGNTVYKAFSASKEAWRETRVLRDDERDHLDSVRHAPVIFQEYVPAGVDLRVTVMGDAVFPAAIHAADTSYEVDYRMTIDEARVETADLPGEVLDAVHRLMDRLDLTYGAIDLRRRPDGEHVFLEVNPAGQWLFVEQRTGQPMTETFADLLAARDD